MSFFHDGLSHTHFVKWDRLITSPEECSNLGREDLKILISLCFWASPFEDLLVDE